MSEVLYESLLESCEREDDLGVVIRTQIVVEQYLNNLIDLCVTSPAHVRKMDLDYSSTVKLAMALGLDSRFESSLNCLGKIRNDFAHNLRPEISKNDVNNFYKSLDSMEKQTLNVSVDKARKESNPGLPPHSKMSERQ